MLFNSLGEFYREYEMPLARAFYSIEQRGLAVDRQKLSAFRAYLLQEEGTHLVALSKIAGRPVAGFKKEAAKTANSLNLGYYKDVVLLLESLGLDVPRDRQTGKKTTAD